MKYVVVLSDRADADRDRLNLFYARHAPDFGERWDAGLVAALDGLTGFPGPLSWAKDEEASAAYGQEIRRLLYYGPTRRRTGTPLRVLFTLLPPDPSPSEEEPETIIFLLRLLHGTQSPDAGDETAP